MKLSAESANLEFDTFNQTINAGQSIPLQISQQVNWRTVLGDMYDKYDNFLIVFNSFGGFTGTNMTYNGSAASNTNVWTAGITSDIQFLGNTVNAQLSSIAYFPTRFALPSGNGYSLVNSTINNGIVFQKPYNSTSQINVSVYQVRNGTQCLLGVSTGSSTYDYNFSFSIYGLSQ
ncbi:MAG: hypothetical protein ACOVOV_19120 [Dolichospermum sp.]